MSVELLRGFNVYFGIFGACICWLFMLTIIISYHCVTTQPFKSAIKWSIVICVMFGFTCIELSHHCKILNGISFEMQVVTSVLWTSAWRLGFIAIYILFFTRFQITFQNTNYPASKPTIIAFIILIITYILLQFVHLSLYILAQLSVIPYNIYAYFGVIKLIFEIVIDLALSIGLICLYIKRLWQLHIDIGSNDVDDIQQNKRTKPYSLKPTQWKIVRALSKMLILSVLPITSSQLALFYDLVTYILRLIHGQNYTVYTRVELLFFSYIIVDSMINSLCILLSFDFMNKWYYRLCGNLDNCCVKIIHNRSKKKHSNTLSEPLLEIQESTLL